MVFSDIAPYSLAKFPDSPKESSTFKMHDDHSANMTLPIYQNTWSRTPVDSDLLTDLFKRNSKSILNNSWKAASSIPDYVTGIFN
jgi:hypothetical protein